MFLKYRCLGSFPSDYVSSLDNDTFAVINEQPSKMQDEHWVMIAKFSHELYFADSLGRKKYRFLKQHYKQMMRIQLQSHPRSEKSQGAELSQCPKYPFLIH